MELNIAENRNHLNYSKWVYVKRILWTFGKFFFRNSPRIALHKSIWSSLGDYGFLLYSALFYYSYTKSGFSP